jgi:hypothetical protein
MDQCIVCRLDAVRGDRLMVNDGLAVCVFAFTLISAGAITGQVVWRAMRRMQWV